MSMLGDNYIFAQIFTEFSFSMLVKMFVYTLHIKTGKLGQARVYSMHLDIKK